MFKIFAAVIYLLSAPSPSAAFFNMNMMKKKAAVTAADCANTTPAAGTPCTGGGIFLGTYNYGGAIGTKKLMTTESGCDNSATPSCPGTADAFTLAWGTFNITTNATSLDDGDANTTAIVSADSGAAAAKYCANMVYAGFSDWYLPAQNELNVIYTNAAAISGLNLSNTGYWSSTEASAFSGFGQRFDSGAQIGNAKTLTEYVRCVRRF